MIIRSDRIFHRYVVAIIALVPFVTTTPGDAYGDAPRVARDKDKRLLSEVRLPQDPRREPYEEYYHRFLIRTKQGQTFIAAYWRQDGSYLAVMLDIFRIERTPKGPEGRLLTPRASAGKFWHFMSWT